MSENNNDVAGKDRAEFLKIGAYCHTQNWT
jgi:hypothetical protein